MSERNDDQSVAITTLSYDDLRNFKMEQTTNTKEPTHADSTPVNVDNAISTIGQAFGDSPTSLGIIAITNVPPHYSALRSKLLKLSHQFATQTSKEMRISLTREDTFYSVGWSHGKEKLEGDKLDMGKGSFYANPLTDSPIESILKRDFDEEEEEEELKKRRNEFLTMAEQNPAFYAPNVWPSEELPEMEYTMKEMGKLIQGIGIMVATLCDAYVSKKCPKLTQGKIENVVTKSLCCKARLLHYFPIDDITVEENDNTVVSPSPSATNATSLSKTDNDTEFSDWCGWHNDHCSLTGLVPAMYLDSSGNEISCPDSNAGLYIKSRRGELIHVKIPHNAIAFQVGETTQIHTGGILQATPHAVKGFDRQKSECKGVSRESFAVFMEPEFPDDMSFPEGRTIRDVQREESERYLPKTVRTLRSRWKPDMNFGDFSNTTFAAFY